MTGRVIARQALKGGEAGVLQTGGWASGLYTVVIKDAAGRMAGSQKVVR
jgi:hypothetical protein